MAVDAVGHMPKEWFVLHPSAIDESSHFHLYITNMVYEFFPFINIKYGFVPFIEECDGCLFLVFWH